MKFTINENVNVYFMDEDDNDPHSPRMYEDFNRSTELWCKYLFIMADYIKDMKEVNLTALHYGKDEDGYNEGTEYFITSTTNGKNEPHGRFSMFDSEESVVAWYSAGYQGTTNWPIKMKEITDLSKEKIHSYLQEIIDYLESEKNKESNEYK